MYIYDKYLALLKTFLSLVTTSGSWESSISSINPGLPMWLDSQMADYLATLSKPLDNINTLQLYSDAQQKSHPVYRDSSILSNSPN